MRGTNFRKHLIIIASLAWLVWSAAAEPGATILVHSANREEIDELGLAYLLSGKRLSWKSGTPVAIALKSHTGMDKGRFDAYWRRLSYYGQAPQLRVFRRPEDVVAFVARTPGAIGIVGPGAAIAGVRKLKERP